MTQDRSSPSGGARRAAAKVRFPAVAGAFYPRDPPSLRSTVEECFTGPRGPGAFPTAPPDAGRAPQRTLVAGVAPHAGYVYSGAVAAHLFLRLARERAPSTVLLLGVNHHGRGSLFSVTDEDWRTPLGTVPTDRELVGALAHGPVELDPRAQDEEHSIEVEVPFLQTIYPVSSLRVVALQVTFTDFALLEELGRHIRRTIEGKDVLLLASTDLSHYLPPGAGKKQDDRALEPLLRMDARGLYDRVVREDISMCGIAPTTAMLCALAGTSARAELLSQGNSGDAEPMDRVVGYASVAISRKDR